MRSAALASITGKKPSMTGRKINEEVTVHLSLERVQLATEVGAIPFSNDLAQQINKILNDGLTRMFMFAEQVPAREIRSRLIKIHKIIQKSALTLADIRTRTDPVNEGVRDLVADAAHAAGFDSKQAMDDFNILRHAETILETFGEAIRMNIDDIYIPSGRPPSPERFLIIPLHNIYLTMNENDTISWDPIESNYRGPGINFVNTILDDAQVKPLLPGRCADVGGLIHRRRTRVGDRAVASSSSGEN